MRSILLSLTIAVLLGGCANDHKLAGCKGPLIALNSDHWRPTPEQMAALSKACPEDK